MRVVSVASNYLVVLLYKVKALTSEVCGKELEIFFTNGNGKKHYQKTFFLCELRQKQNWNSFFCDIISSEINMLFLHE